MKIFRIVLAVFFLTSVAIATANAGEMGGACKADREKFCKDVKSGDGAVAKCMKEHKSELTAECKSKIEARVEKIKTLREACKDDLKKFCSKVERGQGNKKNCLMSHESILKADCKASLKK